MKKANKPIETECKQIESAKKNIEKNLYMMKIKELEQSSCCASGVVLQIHTIVVSNVGTPKAEIVLIHISKVSLC